MNVEFTASQEVAMTPWPGYPNSAAGAFAVHVQEPSGMERTFWGWIDTAAAPSTHVWPGTTSAATTPVAQVVASSKSVVVTVENFAQGDDLLAHVRLADGSEVEPADSRVGVLGRAAGRAYADAVRELLTTAAAQGGPTESSGAQPMRSVTGVPPSHPASACGSALDLESWHLAEESGEVLRALEHGDPVLDADGEELRARRFLVLRTGSLLGELVLPVRSAARWWPTGSSPLLDAPLPLPDMPVGVARLLQSIQEASAH
ncbi:MAG: hypothetical protein ACTIOA_05385 [Brachybacterium tyrofermentans]|uniref:hypothetical protein n=2 Tax=Brachybacterium tyrofermentans TaxID=47848 RepID=UPI003F8E04D5